MNYKIQEDKDQQNIDKLLQLCSYDKKEKGKSKEKPQPPN